MRFDARRVGRERSTAIACTSLGTQVSAHKLSSKQTKENKWKMGKSKEDAKAYRKRKTKIINKKFKINK